MKVCKYLNEGVRRDFQVNYFHEATQDALPCGRGSSLSPTLFYEEV